MKISALLMAGTVAVVGAVGVMPAAHAEAYTVKMKFDDESGDLYFEPAKLKIEPGDTVVWIQDDADNEHNVAAYPDRIPQGSEPFESPMLTMEGETWTMTFDKPGSYFYHCHPHEAAGMRGLVVVGRDSLPEEFRQSGSDEMSHDHGEANSDEADAHEEKAMGDHHGNQDMMETKERMKEKGHHGHDGDESHD